MYQLEIDYLTFMKYNFFSIDDFPFNNQLIRLDVLTNELVPSVYEVHYLVCTIIGTNKNVFYEI